MTDGQPWDVILVGGGLANGLIALRLSMLRPHLRVLVVEAGATFGGNHTWSFHETDITAAQRAWTQGLVTYRWPGYEVLFPGLRRRLPLAYCSVTSDRFHEVLTAIAPAVRFGTRAVRLDPDGVVLEDGTALRSRVVIDGRGPQRTPHLRLGFQKFYGQEVRLAAPHGLAAPVLMDATVEQVDGYRFIYLLPFASDRVLIEDTCYSDRPGVDVETFARRIDAYARQRGWAIEAVLRDETGVLPITLAGDIDAFWADHPVVPVAGLRAGLFHPTTGYSWAEAVRLADRLAALATLDAAAVRRTIRETARARWRMQRFFRSLNRVWFTAADDQDRWRVMQRFYGLPEDLIARFYAGDLSGLDRIRLVSGRPPVAIAAALMAMLDIGMRRRSPPAGRARKTGGIGRLD